PAARTPTVRPTAATTPTDTFGSFLMAVFAKRPIAVAPYMGENAFIAFGLAAFGISWQQRLGAVFVSGVVFLIILLVGIRTWLADAITPSMKQSFAAGIGLFLTFIGLVETGIVTTAQGVPVKIGDVTSRPVL